MPSNTGGVMASEISGDLSNQIGARSPLEICLHTPGPPKIRKSHGKPTPGALIKRKWRSKRLREFDPVRFYRRRHKWRLKRRAIARGFASDLADDVRDALAEGVVTLDDLCGWWAEP